MSIHCFNVNIWVNFSLRPLSLGKNFAFGCIFFVFHANLGTIINHLAVLSDISYQNSFRHDWNEIENFQKIFSVLRKIGMN